MAGKHQIKTSSKKGRTGAARKIRRKSRQAIATGRAPATLKGRSTATAIDSHLISLGSKPPKKKKYKRSKRKQSTQAEPFGTPLGDVLDEALSQPKDKP